ncbi:MAG: hypothetical protein JSS07_12500 [Proteobacteria bacterium]|nr:hypothetical protein [Pseudomonadota bacterium]
MLKHFRTWVALVYIVALHPNQIDAACRCNSIIIVSSNSHFAMVHRIEAALYAQPTLEPKPIHFIADNIPNPTFLAQHHKSCLIVTIGTEALTKILKLDTSLPVLSVLTRKKSFESQLETHGRHLNDPKHPHSVIYLDQPLERQLNLLKSLLPNPKTENNVGILLGTNSLSDQERLQKFASKKGLKLTTVNVNNFENPVAVLDGLLDDVNIVLALPDNRIYNNKTTRGMLLTAFHKRVPIIGYSKSYVNHGALGAVYSSTKQLADQTAVQIMAILKNNLQLPAPQYPNEFLVEVNYHVAHTLGLVIADEDALKQTLEKMERKANG